MRTTEFYQRCVIASLQAGDSAEVSSIRAKEAVERYQLDILEDEVSKEERISSVIIEFYNLTKSFLRRLIDSYVLRK